MKKIMNRTKITDMEKLKEVVKNSKDYTGNLPKYLEPLRPIISGYADERSSGNPVFVDLKEGLNVYGDTGLQTVSGMNKEELMDDFRNVDVN